MDVYDLRNKAPKGTEFICSVWGFEIQYFKEGDDGVIFEWNGCYWIKSSLHISNINIEVFDLIICM